MRLLIGLCVFAVFATPGIADENNRLFLGLGYDDFREIREPSAIVSVDYDFAQIWKFKRWKWRLSGVAISDGDYWVGAGISFSHRFGGGPGMPKQILHQVIINAGKLPRAKTTVSFLFSNHKPRSGIT